MLKSARTALTDEKIGFANLPHAYHRDWWIQILPRLKEASDGYTRRKEAHRGTQPTHGREYNSADPAPEKDAAMKQPLWKLKSQAPAHAAIMATTASDHQLFETYRQSYCREG